MSVVADFVQRAEDIRIEDLAAEGAIEAFDILILHGFARLREVKVDSVLLAPGVLLGGGKLSFMDL